MPLRNMPLGTIVHNVEMKAGKGGQIARSPGLMSSWSGAIKATPSCASLRRASHGALGVPGDDRRGVEPDIRTS